MGDSMFMLVAKLKEENTDLKEKIKRLVDGLRKEQQENEQKVYSLKQKLEKYKTEYSKQVNENTRQRKEISKLKNRTFNGGGSFPLSELAHPKPSQSGKGK